VILVPLAIAAVSVIVKLFNLSYRGFGPGDISEGLFMLTFGLILPFTALACGMTLFQLESWTMVWTFPVGKFRVLARKSLTGFFLILASALLSLMIFSMTSVPDIVFSEIVAFWLVTAILFVLGVIAGIATKRAVHGVIFLILSVAVSLFLLFVTGLWLRVAMSIIYFSLLWAAILCLVLILFLKASWYLLFARVRPTRPVFNALLGGGLIVASVFCTALLDNAVLLHYTSLRSLDDLQNVWIQPGNESTILVEGMRVGPSWLKSLAKKMDVNWTAWPLPALLDLKTGKVTQLGRFISLNAVQVSPDGTLMAGQYYQWEGATEWGMVLTVWDMEGKVRYSLDRLDGRVPVEQILWLPGAAHRLALLSRKSIEVHDVDRNSIETIDLPKSDVITDDVQMTVLGDSLYFLSVYGEDGYRIWKRKSGEWISACESGTQARQHYQSKRKWQFGLMPSRDWFQVEDRMIFLRERSVDDSTQCVAFNREYRMRPTNRGVVTIKDGTLTLQSWDNGSEILKLDFPERSAWVIPGEDGETLYTAATVGKGKRFLMRKVDLLGGNISDPLKTLDDVRWSYVFPSNDRDVLIEVYGNQVIQILRFNRSTGEITTILEHKKNEI